MTAPRVSAVVVSYRVCDLLRRCLETLRAQVGVSVEVWVVDNASDDGSADMVEREFPDVRLIRNGTNVGFARANNQALARAAGDALVLVNPDTELPADALATSLAVLDSNPHAGVVGLALHCPDGTPQRSCGAFPGVWNLALEASGLWRPALSMGIATPAASPVQPTGVQRVDWVMGAFFAIRSETYRRVGGLDEALFMYGEEIDWCWRARAAGYVTLYCADVSVLHHGGASGEGLRGPLFVKNLEARIHFLRRHRGAWRAALGREIMVAGAVLRLAYWKARAALERRRGPASPWTLDQCERFRSVVDWRRGRVA